MAGQGKAPGQPLGRVALIGCGKMGAAMARGWCAAPQPPDHLIVIEPHTTDLADLAAHQAVTILPDVAALPADAEFDTLVLAVKPQSMDGVLAALAPRLIARLAQRQASGQPLVISIAAGKSLDYFQRALPPDTPVVRAMPNLPASIGRGITVCVASAGVSPDQRGIATALLSACGPVEWVAEEALLDPVTALSGGGPAWVFLLIEAMAAAGIKQGLPADLAQRLARVTVAGAGELVHQSDLPAATLRENVCSPGGTTIEAMRVLMGVDGWQDAIDRAMAASTARSRALGQMA